jgi:hypothetical protein
MFRLLLTYSREEKTFAVPEGEARLGSASENDIVVRVTGVSRRHALIRRYMEGVEVIDLGSKNGLLVDGLRVERVVLTPGLRLQIGAAWLEIEELSSLEAAFEMMLQSSSESGPSPSPITATVKGHTDPRILSPTQSALALAYHIAQVGVGLPGERADLLSRIKAALGAEAIASFDRTSRGVLRSLESDGRFSPTEAKHLTSLAEDSSSVPERIILKRAGHLLLSGRDPWFLGASFAGESLAREGWRKDFLRFMAHELLAPTRSFDDMTAREASRVLSLVRGNKRRAAAILGISPGTLYKFLSRRSSRLH